MNDAATPSRAGRRQWATSSRFNDAGRPAKIAAIVGAVADGAGRGSSRNPRLSGISATGASTAAATSARRTPPVTPWAAINRPPIGAPMTRGTRTRIDWTLNATARRSRGSEAPMTANVVGNAPALQAITPISPANTSGQLRAAAYVAYPAMASAVKINSARPQAERSASQPPGYW